jgi:S1-C subfamily serine protease
MEVEKLHKEVLYPSIRVRAGGSGGSGTVLYSKKDEKGNARTFVLTNHHVVDGLIRVEKVWDARYGKDIKKDVRKTAEVQFFKYNNWSKCIGSFSVEADIVAYEREEDMALLELRDSENVAEFVANIIPTKDVEDIHIFDEIWISGATLGHPPFSTRGTVSYQDDEIDNKKYWLGTAMISFGNSGGSVFREREGKYEFIGVPSRVQMQGFGDAANWMGYFIPPNRVFDFFKRHGFEFVVNDSKTLEECEKERNRQRDKSRKRMEMAEGVVEDDTANIINPEDYNVSGDGKKDND